ncbi:hypothetical protein A11A3_16065 [Alcanivorax hongdengensis A-11-3]|uniref:YecA family protein n=1 Tax=Alcanivorax hongdengensis A-11-3 TaxID=1177179 RepID=L0WB67_9GAMM|nr:YecA family protein [Alcanivorax hongdengensis]EKF72955.1 hypothetical protein A11A3_16065 [Alcanivorax hongdengensis A-11-3]
MSAISNPSLKNTAKHYFESQGDDAPTWTELHGLLCALAVGPQENPADLAAHLDMPVPDEVADSLEQLRQRLTTQLLGGEPINLPCLLDPYQEDDGQDLASWCAGFMSGVFVDEAAWYEPDEEAMVQLLLPFVLISGLDDDPELDNLWQDTKVIRQMALGIPELLEELFLFFHGPDQGDDTGND